MRGQPLSAHSASSGASSTPGGTSPAGRGDPIGLGLRYATLIESYSAMMSQVELLGDQLLEERNRVVNYEEKEKEWAQEKIELETKISSYRSRLDAELASLTVSGSSSTASSSSSPTALANKSSSSAASNTMDGRRMAMKIDALEGHVVRLRVLLQKADEEQDTLRENLVLKERKLRHHELIHDQSLEKLMELQKKEMDRGRIQIEREKNEKNEKEKRRTNSQRNQSSSSSSSSSSSKKMNKRSNSFFGSFRSRTRSLSKAESDGGNGSGDSGGMKNKIRVPLRGGGGSSSSSSSSSSSRTTKGYSKTLNIPLLHGGGGDGGGGDGGGGG